MHTINEHIIVGLQQGDPHIMEQVFQLYYAPLCNYAKRYTGDIVVAEEIVSDVMYKVWQRRNTGYYAATFREYLFTATRNTALNYLKQQKNIRKLSDNWAEQLRDELIGETPLDILIASELQSNIDELMNALPEQCRKAFHLSRMENLTYEEVAVRMNISVNTVKFHIKTALLKLRDGLRHMLIWILLI